MKVFDPSEVKKSEIDSLTDLEFRVYALHYSPLRTDCVDSGYVYELDEENAKAFVSSKKACIEGIDVFTGDDSTLLHNLVKEYYPLPKGTNRELISRKL